MVTGTNSLAAARLTYFAYGSNLLTARLLSKDRAPGARRLGTGRLPGAVLRFDKRGSDGSGKCHFLEDDEPGAIVYGALFEIEALEIEALDRVEGVGHGYLRTAVDVIFEGRWMSAVTYVAQDGYVAPGLEPFEWYRELVLAGARESGFPADYVQAIAATSARRDPDRNRDARMRSLLPSFAELVQDLPGGFGGEVI